MFLKFTNKCAQKLSIFSRKALFASGLLTIFLLSSCSTPKLHIYSDYLSRKNLASFRVGTPDPLLNDPPVGQRLVISWFLPSSYKDRNDLYLQVTLRFRNGEEDTFEKPICSLFGTFVYSIINDNFFETGGFLTFKVDLMSEEGVIKEWRHQLWTEKINLSVQDCNPDS